MEYFLIFFFSLSKQPSNRHLLSSSESRQSITGWSNYAMMKLFEVAIHLNISLITLGRPFPASQSQIAGISFLECRSDTSWQYFADSDLHCNQFSSMPIADGGNGPAAP